MKEKARIDITASLKRIAWTYGCSRHGSDYESELLVLLLAKAAVTKPADADLGQG